MYRSTRTAQPEPNYWSPAPGETVRVRWYLYRGGHDDECVGDITGVIASKTLGRYPVQYHMTDGRTFNLAPSTSPGTDPLDRATGIIVAKPERL